ncbi:DUF4432 family protein [uncultured Friedmanniella sp.]|uniref:DUF4432 family protein n=1 Tax=uncultured Friedmanniella sp. TaxID=335381 RepID=UPI0035CC9662
MAELTARDVRGWEVLRLTSDQVSVDVVPALGGTVTDLTRRADGASLLWSTPWGLRHRGSLPVPGSSEAVMLDSYPGGWQTLFPNGGDTAVVHGVEWGHDGEARVTWLEWELRDGALELTGRLVRSPFALTKTVRVEDDTVTVTEHVTNQGGEQVEVMWGSQLAFGGDLIGPGTSLSTSASVVRPDPRTSSGASYEDLMPWPRSHGPHSVVNLSRLPGPDAGESRLAYLSDFGTPTLTVLNAAGTLGVDLTWDESRPYLWYSLEAGGRDGFPWFGNGYFLALTPSSSWPAHGLHEVRRTSATARWAQPGEQLSSRVSVRVHPDRSTRPADG